MQGRLLLSSQRSIYQSFESTGLKSAASETEILVAEEIFRCGRKFFTLLIKMFNFDESFSFLTRFHSLRNDLVKLIESISLKKSLNCLLFLFRVSISSVNSNEVMLSSIIEFLSSERLTLLASSFQIKGGVSGRMGTGSLKARVWNVIWSSHDWSHDWSHDSLVTSCKTIFWHKPSVIKPV